MKSKDLKPLKVSLHGMNERMHKMMVNYLKLPCKGIAIVVDDDEALAEIVDVDLSLSKSLLEERLAQQPSKPIIALSLNEISTSGVIYVKKPIEVPDVLAAFAVAKDVILGKTSLERTAEPTDTPSKTSAVPDEAKAPSKPKTQLESTNNAADHITQALQKSEATGNRNDPQDFLHDILHKKAVFEDTKQQPKKPKKVQTRKKSDLQDLQNVSSLEDTIPDKTVEKKPAPPETGKSSTTQDEIVQPAATPEFLKQDDISVKPAPIDDTRENKKHFKKTKTIQASSKSEVKPTFDQSVTLKQHAVEQTISAKEAIVAKPDKDQQQTKEKTKPLLADKFATPGSFSSFLDLLWQQKNLIMGLTCLFTLIAGIFIFQLTPMYETRARIFISIAKNIDVNSTSTEDTLDKAAAQQKISEIASRQLAGRVINTLQLNTIPEFFAASVISDAQASSSKLRLERQAAEQLSNITDYFLQNLNVTQFKNSPIINIDYKAEDPGLATKIVNQLIEEYLLMQQEKKIEIEQQLIDWETNKLPAAREQIEQSQNALELYVEMNKWSQFEQQFAEDMGVNSEIRALEKKLKADITLYDILVERFENFKRDTDSMEAKLISGAELPLYPSYPNKLRLLLSTLLSAALISILIAYILSALNLGGKKIIGEPI